MAVVVVLPRHKEESKSTLPAWGEGLPRTAQVLTWRRLSISGHPGLPAGA